MKSFENHREIIQHCAENNTEDYNFTKLMEEMAEFQQVVAKIKSKNINNPDRPKKEEMIKEFGDVLYRGMIYLRSQFHDMMYTELLEKIDARVEKKLTSMESYKKLGQYKSGL